MRRLVLLVPLALACTERPEKPPIEAAKVPASTAPATEPPAARRILSKTLRDGAVDRARFESAPRYVLDVDLDLDLLTYRGTQVLHFQNQEKDALEALHFLVYPNAPELTERGALNLSVDRVEIGGKKVPHTLLGQSLKVPLAQPLKPGARIEVRLTFRGVIHRMRADVDDPQRMAMDQLIGLVTGAARTEGGYGVFGHSDGIVSLALWHPILSAYDDRGWDLDPGGTLGDRSYFDVANYEVTVRLPEGVAVATTGVRAGQQTTDGITEHRFIAGAVREFSLQLSKDYVSAETTVGDVVVRSWFLEKHRAVGEQVLDQAAEALRIFDADYGAYPYTELDVAEAPLIGGAGGVEFPGLVTVARMFYGDGPGKALGGGVPPALGRYLAETREFVVAHEVAHQWFNAVIGSDSKRHPFVDEALANHAAIHYFEKAHGPKAAERQRLLQLRLNYHAARLAGARDRPVDLPAREYDGMLEYAAMVYAKGGLYFSALRAQMGARDFDAALRDYYRKFTFRIARPDDLTAAFTRTAKDPEAVRALTKRWLQGRHGDADIGRLEIGTLLEEMGLTKALGGLDPQLLNLIEHKGVAELGKLLEALVDPDGRTRADVDLGALTELLGAAFAQGDPELGRMLTAAGKVFGKLDDPNVRASDLFRELGKEVGGGDRQTQMLLEALGLVIEAIEEPRPR